MLQKTGRVILFHAPEKPFELRDLPLPQKLEAEAILVKTNLLQSVVRTCTRGEVVGRFLLLVCWGTKVSVRLNDWARMQLEIPWVMRLQREIVSHGR